MSWNSNKAVKNAKRFLLGTSYFEIKLEIY